MHEGKSWREKTLIIFACAVAALILGVYLLNLANQKPPVAAGPIQTATFADDGMLEVLGVSVGVRVVEVPPQKISLLPFLSSKGSSSGYFGGLNMDTESKGGEVIRCRVHSDTPQAMLMEFRLKDRSGMAMKLANHLVKGEMVFEDGRLGSGRAPTGFFHPLDDRVETLRDAMHKAGLQVLIQHRDPQSGWVHLNGPSMFHEPWPDRYIAALSAWRRDLATLDFRAIRADGQVAEFSLPNPDFRKSPTAGTPTALPFVHKGADYAVTVRRVERFSAPGDHPFAGVEVDFESGGKTITNDCGEAFAFSWQTAEDEWGNVVKIESESIRKKSRIGAFFPADSKRMSARLTVTRTVNTPRFDTAGFCVLEGVVSADGLSVDFKPGPDAALFGITRMPVGRIKPAGRYEPKGPRIDWKMLEYELSGKNQGDELAHIESRVGQLAQWQFLVFPAGQRESGGVIPRPVGGGCGWGRGGFHFDRKLVWLGTPEMLRPGATLKVGIHGPLGSDDVRFELELPTLIQPR